MKLPWINGVKIKLSLISGDIFERRWINANKMKILLINGDNKTMLDNHR
jgi:hypothetical protein